MVELGAFDPRVSSSGFQLADMEVKVKDLSLPSGRLSPLLFPQPHPADSRKHPSQGQEAQVEKGEEGFPLTAWARLIKPSGLWWPPGCRPGLPPVGTTQPPRRGYPSWAHQGLLFPEQRPPAGGRLVPQGISNWGGGGAERLRLRGHGKGGAGRWPGGAGRWSGAEAPGAAMRGGRAALTSPGGR